MFKKLLALYVIALSTIVGADEEIEITVRNETTRPITLGEVNDHYSTMNDYIVEGVEIDPNDDFTINIRLSLRRYYEHTNWLSLPDRIKFKFVDPEKATKEEFEISWENGKVDFDNGTLKSYKSYQIDKDMAKTKFSFVIRAK